MGTINIIQSVNESIISLDDKNIILFKENE